MTTKPPLIITSSRLQVWWLTRFCGYKVCGASHEPRRNIFGQIAYTSTWRLEHNSNGKK